MTKKDLQLAYALAIVCFVVGIISYAAFPAKTPDTPLRLMFHSSAGKIWFDHDTHADQAGYGISCEDCHHYTDPYKAASVMLWRATTRVFPNGRMLSTSSA